MVKMRIDIKTVKGRDYLQYVDVHGHIFHIGSANKLENWQLAYYLFGSGLEDLQSEFLRKMRQELKKYLKWDSEKFGQVEEFTDMGMRGYVGYGDWPRKGLAKVFDKKAEECRELRAAIKKRFPHITTKAEMRRTVNYNRRKSVRER